jgi:hypothetical protein
MRIVIPGGSGKVGTVLARAFHRDGHDVVVLSRNPRSAPWRVLAWDGRTRSDWSKEIDGASVVINLAGRSVDCRYTRSNRESIRTSRLESTRVVGEAIAQSSNPPPVWLQASTATIYAHRYDTAQDEKTGVLGGNEPDSPDSWRFSIDVATAWERALNGAKTPATRKVLLRSAMTMSPDRGGIFDVLLRPVRFGLGGNAGDGRQFVSWIHENDFVSAVQWIIDHGDISGPVNLASPNPLPYSDFMRTLRSEMRIPVGLPATKWMIEIGTFLLRTESELVLKSRRVVPTRLLQSGYKFHYPFWPEAAKDLCDRWRMGEQGV